MAQVAVNQLDMTDAQKAVFLSYTSYALAGLNASIELNCAWQASVGLNFNIAFPDAVSTLPPSLPPFFTPFLPPVNLCPTSPTLPPSLPPFPPPRSTPSTTSSWSLNSKVRWT